MEQVVSRRIFGPRAIWRTGRMGLVIQGVESDADPSSESEGALVRSVEERGPAARAGIRPGDLILALDDKRVTSVEQLRELLDEADKWVALLVKRDDSKFHIPVRLE